MKPEKFFTAAFGIAPLKVMPNHVKVARITIPEGDCEAALVSLRRVHPNVSKPYWQVNGAILSVVTEPEGRVLTQAMRDSVPDEEAEARR